MVEGDGHLVLIARFEDLEAKLAILGGVGHHATQSGGEPSLAVLVGGLAYHAAELGVVVDLEFHFDSRQRLAILINHGEGGLGGFAVVVNDVDFRDVVVTADHFLWTVVIAENPGMKQQGAGSRLVEPTQIQHGFGLAGAEEVPLAIDVGLHPCVVVVAMGPAGRIDLSRRDAHSA